MSTDSEINAFQSDLAVLHERCQKYGIQTPIGFTKTGRPYIKGRRHIDLCEVFAKSMVRTSIYKNQYRTLKLEDVARALLDKGKFSVGGINGSNASSLPADLQKQYVLQDAQLLIGLLVNDSSAFLCLLFCT